MSEAAVTRFYRQPGLTGGSLESAITKICSHLGNGAVAELQTEFCYYVQNQGKGVWLKTNEATTK